MSNIIAQLYIKGHFEVVEILKTNQDQQKSKIQYRAPLFVKK